MSDWVQRIRDEGRKLEHELKVAVARAEQHLAAAEGVDTVDLEAAEDRDDADAAVAAAEQTPPVDATGTADTEATADKAETARQPDEGN